MSRWHWPWVRSLDERVEAERAIREAERGLAEAQRARDVVERRKDKLEDHLADVVRDLVRRPSPAPQPRRAR